MAHRISVCRTGLTAALEANASIASALADVTWGYKIFAEQAPSNVVQPYILLQHLYGGSTNDTPRDDIDVVFRIVCIAKDHPTALLIAGYIDVSLHEQQLTLTEGWADWATVKNTGDIDDQTNVQNTQFWMVGGYYRIRAVK